MENEILFVTPQQIERALRSARSSMQLSGDVIEEDIVESVRRSLYGEITEEEFLRIALERAQGVNLNEHA